MIIILILSYTLLIYMDLRMTKEKAGKAEYVLYFILMAASFGISTATGYIGELPSPAEPLKRIVFALLGK